MEDDVTEEGFGTSWELGNMKGAVNEFESQRPYPSSTKF